MNRLQAIDRINELLDSGDDSTINTSMRLTVSLRDAAVIAVTELGAAASTTVLTAAALRASLGALVIQAALDEHYAAFPESRSTLGDLAVAAAELDDHPLAKEVGRLRQAAVEIVVLHPDADADDVILWAEARAFASA